MTAEAFAEDDPAWMRGIVPAGVIVRPDGSESVAPQVGAESTDALMYQAAHLATLVAEGATESPLLPLDEVIAVMATMDDLRYQVGNRLPGE